MNIDTKKIALELIDTFKIAGDVSIKLRKDGLIKENVKYLFKKKQEPIPTGTCLILITPDSERTMCTFLGTAGKINDLDINENDIKKARIIFLEGYLWDKGEPKKAFEKAIKNSNKTAMSLSDKFCVDRHKLSFLNLVKSYLDITENYPIIGPKETQKKQLYD